MQLTVHLSERSYPITIDTNCHQTLPQVIKHTFPKNRFALVTNTTIARIYKSLIDTMKNVLDCPVHEMPDGERYKTIETWNGILEFLLVNKFERSSVLIALGGGVVGDVAGFAAAAFLRGISFVQIPTTLLAMVDSSVGGKTAVDHPLGKNLIGAFHQPKGVFVDPAFLATLSEREFRSGYAELFKNAFIGGNEMFDFVLVNHYAMLERQPAKLLEGIQRSIAIKAGIVEKDEHETTGLRALLNFGHTFAHALERYFDFDAILHGEAVWWGMRCAIDCSRRTGTINCESTSRYDAITEMLLSPALPSKPDREKLYTMMFTDKKVADGKLRLVLPTMTGTSIVRGDIPAEFVKETITEVFG